MQATATLVIDCACDTVNIFFTNQFFKKSNMVKSERLQLKRIAENEGFVTG